MSTKPDSAVVPASSSRPRGGTEMVCGPVPAARLAALGGVIAACFVWSYWPVIVDLLEFWRRNEDYSVGALVPLVAAGLLLRAHARPPRVPLAPNLWGLALLLAAEFLRQGGEYFGVGTLPRYAVVFAITGVLLMTLGWPFVRRSRWILLFLFLMVPLPARIHETIALPLQTLATKLAVFGLELLGFFVVREGHVLRVEGTTEIAVTEACSGLRMLTAFIFVSCVFAFLADRPRWQRLALVLFSIPIAVLSNAIRGIATAIYVYYDADPGRGQAFHDGAGIAMMPLALLLLWGLMAFMSLLTGPAAPQAARMAGRRGRPADALPARRRATTLVAVPLVIAALLSGGFAYRQTVAALDAQAAETIRLPVPLATLALELGDWHGVDVALPEGVLRIAGNDDYVNRTYVNRRTGESVTLYVGYTARPRTMLRHRPTVCYPSAGFTHLGTTQGEVAIDGRRYPVALHRFMKPGLNELRVLVLNYYVLNGSWTIDENSFWSLGWRTPNLARDANRYVAQVQIGTDAAGSSEAARATVTSFAEIATPALQALLPGTLQYVPPSGQ